MLTEKERAEPVTVQNLADALSWVMSEVFAALKPHDDVAIEQAARHLLETGQKIKTEPGRSIILALSENLIQASRGNRNGR